MRATVAKRLRIIVLIKTLTLATARKLVYTNTKDATVINAQDTGRAYYRQLKKSYKANKRGNK